ncbi:MAG: hypothetical protein EOM24_34310, partial [Chloroflexia bacterium]|nr:hypothetical protein [Chloroflexia bacterium]
MQRRRLTRCWVLLPCAALILFLTACGEAAGRRSSETMLPTARITGTTEPIEPLELQLPITTTGAEPEATVATPVVPVAVAMPQLPTPRNGPGDLPYPLTLT